MRALSFAATALLVAPAAFASPDAADAKAPAAADKPATSAPAPAASATPPAAAAETAPAVAPAPSGAPAPSADSAPAPTPSPAVSAAEPQAPAASAPASGPAAVSHDKRDCGSSCDSSCDKPCCKVIGVGAELVYLQPFGDFGDTSGPLFGAVLRGGRWVTPRLEVYGRLGYLYGTEKDVGGGQSVGTTIVPLGVGARYFLLQHHAGLFASLEANLHVVASKSTLEGVGGAPTRNTTGPDEGRFGFNAGVGYALSPSIPVFVAVQLTHVNLLKGKLAEDRLFGVSTSLGYEARF